MKIKYYYLFFIFLIVSCVKKEDSKELLEKTALIEETVEKERLVLINHNFSSNYYNKQQEINITIDWSNSLFDITDDVEKHLSLKNFIYETLYNKKTASEYLHSLLEQINLPSSYFGTFDSGGEFSSSSFKWVAKNGNYLFIEKESGYGGGSSTYDSQPYIFDLEQFKMITNEEIFINTTEPLFKLLLLDYLSKENDYNLIDHNLFIKSLEDKSFNLFYHKNGIRFYWNGWVFELNPNVYDFNIVVPYSELQSFMTPLGREAFNEHS